MDSASSPVSSVFLTSLHSRLAFIDVETTGANPAVDRVTEIAILRIEAGVLVERWSSLVNPERAIPAHIQDLVGITDGMVADAPRFAAVAEQVRTLLTDCVFVAHNARFDYGFLKNEFSRLGRTFDASVLCTVKLSRALYPQHHRHGLDALIERHGLSCSARHRALGDAEALHQFAGIMSRSFEPDALDAAVLKAMSAPSRPAGLPEGVLEGVPEGHGVYLFFGEQDVPLFVGRASHLRSQVLGLFAAERPKGRDARIVQQVRRVDWRATAGELESLLLESRLLRELRPSENKVAPEDNVFGLRFEPDRRQGPVLTRVPLNAGDPLTWGEVFGAFRSRKEADHALRELTSLYKLCPRRVGIEPWGEGACLAHQARRCAGVCAGRESSAEHDARLLKVLESLRLKHWPWPGPVMIHEVRAGGAREVWHLVDRWCLLGSVDSAAAFEALRKAPPPRRFDLETCRLLQRWLDRAAGKAAIQPV
ncbi:exonuclease domain-containing protein [Zoogloea sp.]|uniref:exonuclease domain-containing protein n=1 Tax=Zoogloea sp. TaxID=49181 RepID=UPI002620046A|nr:exonuclease domain-containing protein [Zoogloea sp.]MDD3352892.1 exonuclease domain-containing protein [Zoogloea sp.]